MHYIMFLLALLFTNVANAINCQTLPDCASLGYSTEPDPNCADDGYMYCPFDQDYKVCVQYNCKALGFTDSDKTSWCADLIECRGNPLMTLCQKACIATNAQELKELAESGKCKVVTMRNDIIIPENESITLAANTIIDGGNHTLKTSGNKQNLNTFLMNDKTGLENLTLVHQQDSALGEDTIYLQGTKASDQISLRNVKLVWNTSITENQRHPIFALSTYTISGNFDIDVNSQHAWVFYDGNFSFKDAHLHAKINHQYGVIFTATDVSFDGTTAEIFARNVIFSSLSGKKTTTIKNSIISIQAIENYTAYLFDTTPIFVIGEGSSLNLTLTKLESTLAKDSILELVGTASNPSTLTINVNSSEFKNVQIKASNTSDNLVLNGKTYLPTNPATTPLSEIDKSPNWQKE